MKDQKNLIGLMVIILIISGGVYFYFKHQQVTNMDLTQPDSTVTEKKIDLNVTSDNGQTSKKTIKFRTDGTYVGYTYIDLPANATVLTNPNETVPETAPTFMINGGQFFIDGLNHLIHAACIGGEVSCSDTSDRTFSNLESISITKNDKGKIIGITVRGVGHQQTAFGILKEGVFNEADIVTLKGILMTARAGE